MLKLLAMSARDDNELSQQGMQAYVVGKQCRWVASAAQQQTSKGGLCLAQAASVMDSASPYPENMLKSRPLGDPGKSSTLSASASGV
jgi:hypothetical protein